MPRNHRIINNKLIIALSILITFYIKGCSTYSVPKESKVIINKEELPNYNPKNFSQDQISIRNHVAHEDEWIIRAIFLEEEHQFKESSKYYAKLYDATQRDEYLLKEMNTAHFAGIRPKHIDNLKAYAQKYPNNLQAKRLLLSFYLKEKKFTQAKTIGKDLTEHSSQAIDFELAANPYIFTGQYEESLTYLKEAYNKTLNEDILLKIVTIKINYLNQIDDAIQMLEEHRVKQGCSEKICLQLIGIYSQQRKVNKLIPIYKDLYQSTKKEAYIEKVIEIYLVNQDLDTAIRYLESDHKSDTILYSLYMEKKNYLKAYNLTKNLIKKTHNPKWYAESAISFYESLNNKNDKVQLQKVVQNFEKAFSLGVENPVYLNYYGYTLIDKEIDIEKGLKIVNKALSQEPENTYFLDSLAWGYYKKNDCKVAYPTMKKVVEIEGLNEEEIIEHWNAINSKCQNK